MPRLSVPRLDYLLGKSRREGDCTVWTGYQSRDGYGITSVDGSLTRVHRAAWIERHGPIPDGLHVLHRCDNPPCFADEHLYLGTHADNMRDKAERGRAAKGFGPQTHCPHGHEYTPENTQIKNGCRNCRECDRVRHRRSVR